MELYAVRIFVRQWDKACEFYGNKLGLTQRFRDDQMGWAEFDLGGPCFGIERVSAEDEEGNAMVGRFVGASLRVADIHATHNSLASMGVQFDSPPQEQPWGGTLAHMKDPDGNVLTLLG